MYQYLFKEGQEEIKMQAIKKKLGSQRGASITFALLIFLVCAVVGSVVLTAATAASGRMSRLAEMDQRYYSVTSAADLLAKELSNKKISIVRTQEYTDSVSTTYTLSVDENGEEIINAGTPVSSRTDPEYSTKINEQEVVGTWTASSFLTKQAVRLMYGDKNFNTEAAFDFSLKNGNADEGTFTLSHENNEALGINGNYKLKKDGTLMLILKDTIGEDHYTITVSLKPHIREWPDSETDKLPIEIKNNESDSGYTEIAQEKTVLYKYSEIYWTLSSISTGDE